MSERQKTEEYPQVEFGEGFVVIKVRYEQVATADHVDFERWATQQRLSQRFGRDIALEEIEVSPEVGEIYYEVCGFRVKQNWDKPYIGLTNLHKRKPEVLPGLVGWLEVYPQTQDLSTEQKHLLITAIGGLRRIIDPKVEQ